MLVKMLAGFTQETGINGSFNFQIRKKNGWIYPEGERFSNNLPRTGLSFTLSIHVNGEVSSRWWVSWTLNWGVWSQEGYRPPATIIV